MPPLAPGEAMVSRSGMAWVALEVTAQTEKRERSDTDGDNERCSIANPDEVSYVFQHCLLILLLPRRWRNLRIQFLEGVGEKYWRFPSGVCLSLIVFWC